MIKNNDLLDILSDAAKIIEKHYNSPIDVNYKEDKSPVTIADIEVNTFLKNSLMDLLPSAGWLSEESKDNPERLEKEYIWVVDPIDGTKEFISRVPELAISVSLVHKDKPVLGAVMNPITKEYGIGSIWENIVFENQKKKELSQTLIDSTVIVSRTEESKGKIDKFKSGMPGIKAVGSVAYKLLRIASESDDFYFSVNPKSEWDICGGVALIELSGKKYQRFDNFPNKFNQKDIRIQSGAVAGSEKLVKQFFEEFSDLI